MSADKLEVTLPLQCIIFFLMLCTLVLCNAFVDLEAKALKLEILYIPYQILVLGPSSVFSCMQITYHVK